MLKRDIENNVRASLFKGRAIIIYGARQVGKTTLLHMLRDNLSEKSLFLNCDEPDIPPLLTDATSTELRELTGGYKIVFIDEAQRVKNIGITLKLFTDEIPEIQVIASGSSSLELSNEIVEPLTGRKYQFQLYPFSLSELSRRSNKMELKRLLEHRIIYGMYPEVTQTPGVAENLLKEISSSYLYKDLLQYQDIRKPQLLQKLLTSLALQVGNEVSYNELANSLGVNRKTISKYMDLLEKCFVIFRLGPFSRNLRNELTKMRKVYFWDTGIRNALIRNFNPLDLRQDTGLLWENFLLSERIKHLRNSGMDPASYFWRTHRQQEIDYIEEVSGQLKAYEIKWNTDKKVHFPKPFREAYPGAETAVVHRENFWECVGL
ncbi:MAG: ATP-binding protein [Planctomycetes bacterium]|nr:ATP-binding protein [Planctomycetota bacterium]